MIELDKVHTTELGALRIIKNLGLNTKDPVSWCKQKIKTANKITRKGKNWYADIGDAIITVNAYSFTIITAHKK